MTSLPVEMEVLKDVKICVKVVNCCHINTLDISKDAEKKGGVHYPCVTLYSKAGDSFFWQWMDGK